MNEESNDVKELREYKAMIRNSVANKTTYSSHKRKKLRVNLYLYLYLC